FGGLHAHGALAVEKNLGGVTIRLDTQALSFLREAQIRGRAARAQARAREKAVVAGALLLPAVEVAGSGHAQLARRADEGLDQLVLRADLRHGHAALLEVRQHLLPAPARVAERGPAVVV